MDFGRLRLRWHDERVTGIRTELNNKSYDNQLKYSGVDL